MTAESEQRPDGAGNEPTGERDRQESARPLPAEVRQQLTTIGADVIGRTPAAELPPGLRRFARFAPAKRLRLGAAEIAAALATDEAFRARIAEVVRSASPELVETVLQGAPPATADPTDIAVVAYLMRPSGWQDLIERATQNLSELAGRRDSQHEQERLAAELERLRDANADAVRARDAIRQGARREAAEHAQQLSELNRQLRSLQSQLRSSQRAAEAAVADAEAARAERRSAASTASAELRKARSRIAELEQQLDAARRAGRSERDHDNARLWLLVEQIAAATAGLRSELDISRPELAPADTVESTATRSASRPSTIDGSLLERLLNGPHVHLLVDGYNITKTAYPELTLADQRSRLVSSLGALAARTGVEVTVAFDGTAAPVGAAASLPTPRGVRVLFSAPGELADDLIRALLRAEPAGRTVVVASSDGEVAAASRGAGYWVVSAGVLVSRLDRS